MTVDHDKLTLAAIEPLRAAGFALHWLKVRDKAPFSPNGEWQDAPVASIEDLRATHFRGANVGVRLGEPSLLACGWYLYVIDLDIRVADLADEAWEAFAGLFPDVDPASLPSVISGSGGESRHLYFISNKPFHGKKLAVSEGKHRRFDKKKGREVWSYDWEIDLFGTGRQVAMPPSIHPDSGLPYLWEREFDFDALEFGIGPEIPASVIESLGVAETAEYAFERREPLDFKPGQLEGDLDVLPVDRWDDRDSWIMIGQALHHQFGGSDEGFDLWARYSAKSTKCDKDFRRANLRRYRTFGRNRRAPVTMGTIRQWAQDARLDDIVGGLDDLDDLENLDGESSGKPAILPTSDADSLDDGDDFESLVGAAANDDDDLDAIFSKGLDTPTELSWKSLLAVNKDGEGLAANLHNMELIVKNDPRLIGLPALNEFTQETVQRTAPGVKAKRRKNAAKPTRQLEGRVWEVKDTLNGEIWSSARDYAVRSILEAPTTQGGYGIKVTDRDLKAAIVLAAWENTFHPVREYLTGLAWDGKSRVETLFIDYLGAEDNAYNRAVARLMMVAAVARVFEPGHKWDFAVILEGLQGRGKSTFIRALGKRWFAELEGDFHDGKEMVEKMQGAWIMEIPELSGFNRADVRSIKAFISRQVDKVRLAYEARATEFPRQCILIGSTNDREYLKDDTGGRRFFPMECHVDMIDIPRLRANVDLLWAEARAIYLAMRAEQPEEDLPLYLTDADAAAEAARLQESRRVESSDDAQIGKILAVLDAPVVTGSLDDDGEGGMRNVTCLVEVWQLLGNEPRAYGPAQAQSLGRSMSRVPGWRMSGRLHNFPQPFGRQRYYERLDSPGIHEPISPKKR